MYLMHVHPIFLIVHCTSNIMYIVQLYIVHCTITIDTHGVALHSTLLFDLLNTVWLVNAMYQATVSW